jgi:hypothetical protein
MCARGWSDSPWIAPRGPRPISGRWHDPVQHDFPAGGARLASRADSRQARRAEAHEEGAGSFARSGSRLAQTADGLPAGGGPMSRARRRLSASLQEVTAGASFFLGVPAFVRSRVTGDAARAILDRRRRSRPDDFLALTRRSIYDNPRSPYRRLLALAGCEYGDLEALVTREGLDEALAVLFRQGVDRPGGAARPSRSSLASWPIPARPLTSGPRPAGAGGRARRFPSVSQPSTTAQSIPG